jgi:hypothetical protein
VLVIADERPGGIGGERGLAGPAETEEKCHVARIVGGHVGRTVHGEDAHLRQVIVHRVEDGLLHLARVLGAEDDHLALLERLDDRHGRVETEVGEIIDPQTACVHDRPVRLEAGQRLGGRVDEERLGEETVPRQLGDDRDLQPVVGVGAGQSVEAKELLAR